MEVAIIDTHIHIWDFTRARYGWLDNDTSILKRTYAIEEIEVQRVAAGVRAGVLVQAANNLEDTDWILEVATHTDWIAGVTGWLPLADPEEAERVYAQRYKGQPLFKGVRHLIHDETDPRWLLQPTVIEGLRLLAREGLVFELVGVRPEHIETALEVAVLVPRLRMIFDHLNQPPIASGERFGRWGALMKEACGHPSFLAKISGLGATSAMGDRWTAKDIEPYVEFILTHFGVERCCCGSDWPVSLLAGTYERTWKVYREALASLLDASGQAAVLGENAVRFYGLNL
ncbi:amidohydrolase family protein [Dinghuibacter silviterrae]|uniref:L-fuconolactonase n=1 Tax=Dinghuibacter silviterrae TaxID=1539049 RepID=A0A4R8DVX8_9BACT|nr:amidohydrolase family protein [Dinghuibacter silviterrae]TDX01371.1 L-fuconolactonase [Dinghuibacter silviterrae]